MKSYTNSIIENRILLRVCCRFLLSVNQKKKFVSNVNFIIIVSNLNCRNNRDTNKFISVRKLYQSYISDHEKERFVSSFLQFGHVIKVLQIFY